MASKTTDIPPSLSNCSIGNMSFFSSLWTGHFVLDAVSYSTHKQPNFTSVHDNQRWQWKLRHLYIRDMCSPLNFRLEKMSHYHVWLLRAILSHVNWWVSPIETPAFRPAKLLFWLCVRPSLFWTSCHFLGSLKLPNGSVSDLMTKSCRPTSGTIFWPLEQRILSCKYGRTNHNIIFAIPAKTPKSYVQLIGWKENLQETMVFTIKHRVFLPFFPSTNPLICWS